MSYLEVMQLPVRSFWLMSGNIDRIESRQDIRAMSVAIVSHANAEGIRQFHQELIVEAGTVVRLEGDSPLDARRDETGFAELKSMAGQTIGV